MAPSRMIASRSSPDKNRDSALLAIDAAIAAAASAADIAKRGGAVAGAGAVRDGAAAGGVAGAVLTAIAATEAAGACTRALGRAVLRFFVNAAPCTATGRRCSGGSAGIAWRGKNARAEADRSRCAPRPCAPRPSALGTLPQFPAFPTAASRTIFSSRWSCCLLYTSRVKTASIVAACAILAITAIVGLYDFANSTAQGHKLLIRLGFEYPPDCG